MATYLTPGVYRTSPAPIPQTPVLARMDIAGFIGYAERGPLPEGTDPFDAAQVVIRLTSWAEFQSRFGGFLPNGYLAFAVRAFFENGGDTCYVLRVAVTTAAPERCAAAAMCLLPSGPATDVGTLAAAGGDYTASLTLATGVDPKSLPGSLIVVERAGLSQTIGVLGQLPDGRFQLAAVLDARFQPHDAVRGYKVGASFVASSRGAWGNRVRLDVTKLDLGAFGLVVTVDRGPGLPPTEQEFYARLDLDPGSSLYAPVVLVNRSVLVRMQHFDKAASIDFSLPVFGTSSLYLAGGRDGLADVTPLDFTGSAFDRRGLRLLEEIDEIGIVAIPDAVLTQAKPMRPPPVVSDPCAPVPASVVALLPPDPTAVPPSFENDVASLQMAMIEHCERLRYRVAVLDPPYGLQPDQMTLWPQQQGLVSRSSKFAAIYYPWLRVPDPVGSPTAIRAVPPSGHVAGGYAQVDHVFGVQHPPANVALVSAVDVVRPLSDLEQGPLNLAGVNAIRTLPGRGIRVWGARSLAAEPDWRFIHVRRLMSAIEATAAHSSRWTVFESNDFSLRHTLAHNLEVLLEKVWSAGGLKGALPKEAFYVKCDDTNNPPIVIDAGQVICEVGVAVAAPMEFVVFEIRQSVAGGEVMEA